MNEKLKKNKLALPLVIVFLLVTAFCIGGKKLLSQWGFDPGVLAAGNFLLFLVSFLSFLLYRRAMLHPTTMGFLRNTYGGLFLKLLVVLSQLRHMCCRTANTSTNRPSMPAFFST